MILNLSTAGRYCQGLGDMVAWAWLAEGPVPLSFYVEGRNREMLEFLGCRIAQNPMGAKIPSDAYNKELGERCKRPRLEIWAEFLGIPCEPKRPKFNLPPRDFMKRRIVLCPHTHFKAREWPPAYWMDLNFELKGRNFEVIWLMESNDPQYAGRDSMAYAGKSMRDVASCLSSAALVIGNDSMPAHLAGTIGRPTLALMGPSHWNVFAHLSDVHPMHSEVTACAGCHFGSPFRKACDMMCQALATLSPQEVADTAQYLVETLNGTQRRIPRALLADKAPKTGG